MPESKVLAALSRAQQNFQTVVKKAENPAFKRAGKVSTYATLESVIEAVRPSLTAEGLIVVQKNVFVNGFFGVETRLVHIESGEEETSQFIAPLEKQSAQGVASILTYARRYEYFTLLGLIAEDDDGNAASGIERPQPGRPKATQTSKTTKLESKQTPNTPSTSKLEPSEQSKPAGQPEPQPSEDRAPEAPETPKSEDVAILPNKAEFDAYIKRAKEVAFGLAKAGMPIKDGVAVGVQLVKFITTVTGYESLAAIPKDKWEVLIVKLESGLNTDVQTLIKIINERIA